MLFFEFGCKYGTSPLRVLWFSLIFILFFAAVYVVPASHSYGTDISTLETGTPYLKSYIITGIKVVDVPLSAFLASAGAFVSGFDAVDKNVEGWIAVLLIIEAVTGMLFLGLFIVSFSRKVIR